MVFALCVAVESLHAAESIYTDIPADFTGHFQLCSPIITSFKK